MSRDSRDKKKEVQDPEQVDLVNIVRHGTELVLPETLSPENAIRVLERLMEQEEEFVNMGERVLVFPWDGARALKKAIEQMFGVAIQNGGFFGARQIGVEVGVNKTIQVPWGSFSLPGVEGQVGCSAEYYEGRLVFVVTAEVKRKYENHIKQLIDLTREIASRESIYRGQAVKMRFRKNGEVDKSAQPKFMDLRNIEPAVFSEDLQREIDTNIMAPIRYPEAVRAAGTPLKRGVLMAGRYGVGKTLLSANVAKEATANGWTFVYCEDVRELPDALQFAMAYQPCVIFAEDIDRVTSGNRTSEIDEILNQIDGIGTKGAEILTILTTNAVEKIHPAMLRPGRIDVPLFIDPPDPAAVAQLVRMYGRDLIDENEDLSEVGVVLQGRIPAVIREVVERSKLENISRTKGKGDKIAAVDIVAAARTYLKAEARLQPPKDTSPDSALTAFGRGMGEAIAKPLATFLQNPPTSIGDPGNNGHQPVGHLGSSASTSAATAPSQ